MFVYAVFVGAVASVLSALVYIRSMRRGDAKPNRVSWLMWSVAPFIATAATLSSGVGWAALPVLMSGVMPFMVFTASLFVKKAYWKLSPFDYFCGVLSALALILWFVTQNSSLAIVFAIGSDAAAAIPTVTKALRYPETESAWPFTVGIFNAATSFTVAQFWSFTELAFPIYLLAINIVLVLSVYHRKTAVLFRKH
jgi:uncharacterized membrane protein HdeD (DUF308 family)